MEFGIVLLNYPIYFLNVRVVYAIRTIIFSIYLCKHLASLHPLGMFLRVNHTFAARDTSVKLVYIES